MRLKKAVMLGTMGAYADRFHEYQPSRGFAERLEMAAAIQDVDGIEVVYPQDFRTGDETVDAIKASGLPVAALNLNVKGEAKWRNGSFTAPDSSTRSEAVRYLRNAVDLAAELGTDMVTCCPLIDGHNYNFETDYLRQWGWLEEGLAEAAAHRSDVRISLEYKHNEARNYNILSNMGRTLYLCERIGLPHVGVTMDVGHALIANETPAEVMCMAERARRLFYIHLNDNAREWDWDMLPGSVNLWDLLEMVFYLDRLDWDGWLSFDVFTRQGEPVETMNATVSMLGSCVELLAKVRRDQLVELMRNGTPAATFAHLMRSLL